MRITFSVDRDLLRRARERAAALGVPLNDLLRKHIEEVAERDGGEPGSVGDSIHLSGKGNSRSTKFNLDEIYKEWLRGPRHTS